jgi:transcriptional regulator with XRE-family HTH domain
MKEEIYRIFGAQVRIHRITNKLTQNELAEFIGLSRASLANIECGNQRIMLAEAIKLSKALGFSLDMVIVPSSRRILAKQSEQKKRRLLQRIAKQRAELERLESQVK